MKLFREKYNVIILFCFLPVVMNLAQEPLKIAKINSEIIIDGIPDEEIWDQVSPLPLTMYTPFHRGELTEKTEIRVVYDNDFIYVSGKFWDTEKDKIQGNSFVRDSDKGGDFFNVLLDTFNDNETLVTFSTTPAGNKLDAEIANDAELDNPYNLSWNSYWDAAVSYTDYGWSSEIKIPFSSLKFENNNGKAIFGFITHRLIARKNERQVFPDIPPSLRLGAWKASKAQKILFEGVYPTKPVYISPFTVSNLNRKYEKDINRYVKSENFKTDIGLDVKYNITNNSTLDLTYNTDFAQAEADDEQVNLTRFSLFFPEKRQFFQERAGIFYYSLGGSSRLFYSRRIGFSNNLTPVEIHGGARVVSRMGDWDVGILSMQTKEDNGLNSENFGVVRLRKKVINNSSYIGSMITSRVNFKGDYNVNYALDGTFRFSSGNNISVRVAQTLDSDNKSVLKNYGKSLFVNLSYDKYSVDGIVLQSRLARAAKLFNPASGILLRDDYLWAGQTVGYGFLFSESSSLLRFTPSINANMFYTNSTLEFESSRHDLSLKLEWKSGQTMELLLRKESDTVVEEFSVGKETTIPKGEYDFDLAKLSYRMSQGELLRVNFSGQLGSYYDGTIKSISVSPFWNHSKYLEVSGAYEFNEIEFEDRAQKFTSHLIRLKLGTALNLKLSCNVFAQYNSSSELVILNSRLRYNFFDGTDLYLVYNQDFNTRDTLEGLQLPNFNINTVLLKFVYTFIK